MQRIPPQENLVYRDSWPSLFVGLDGSFGGLHMDVAGLSFWQYVIWTRQGGVDEAAILDAISEAGSYRRWQELSMAEAEADGGADGAAAAGKTAPPRRPTVAVAVSKSGDEIELNFEIDSAAPPAPPAPTRRPGPPAPPGGAGQSPRSPPAKGEKKSPKTARI